MFIVVFKFFILFCSFHFVANYATTTAAKIQNKQILCCECIVKLSF